MASDKISKGWDEAEKHLKNDKPQKALDILREVDAEATESKTWRIAGEAKVMLARKSDNNRKLFRESVSHFQKALKSNPNDKAARRGLNNVRSEMDGLGIHAGGSAIFFDDGAPTFMGIVSIIIGLGLILVALKVIPEQLAVESEYDATIVITLYPEAAPNTVASFKEHANAGQYNGIVFHRIIDNFMIQGGDIENGEFSTGWSSAGTGGYSAIYYGQGQQSDMTSWTIPDEFKAGYQHAPGILAMANSGPNTGGSQFYLVDKASTPSHLDNKHTVFGIAVSGQWYGENMSGIDVIDKISQVATDSNSRPTSDVPTIQKIEIVGDQATMHINLLDSSAGDTPSGSAMMTVPGFPILATISAFLAAAVKTRQE